MGLIAEQHPCAHTSGLWLWIKWKWCGKAFLQFLEQIQMVYVKEWRQTAPELAGNTSAVGWMLEHSCPERGWAPAESHWNELCCCCHGEGPHGAGAVMSSKAMVLAPALGHGWDTHPRFLTCQSMAVIGGMSTTAVGGMPIPDSWHLSPLHLSRENGKFQRNKKNPWNKE